MNVIDSHTEGEPTRVIIAGGPDLGSGPLYERLQNFKRDYDHIRSFCVNEPRGYDALVGALLCEPTDTTCAAGVIYFNNAGYLGMCGHGTIGLAVTLAHLGYIDIGRHRFETPVGIVSVDLVNKNEVEIENIASYRLHKKLTIHVNSLGPVTGDVAYGGNWFFLVENSPYPLLTRHINDLTRAAQAISDALTANDIKGANGEPVDHIEFFGPALTKDAHSRNYVLCSGGAYDRSPCGTGTSAKLACLAADGKLYPGEEWIQESIIGSRFIARYRLDENGAIIPSIRGRAYVVSESKLLRNPQDPFMNGLNND
jgi:4-hydroxyproline epimerase